ALGAAATTTAPRALPRLSAPPRLEDFLAMEPPPALRDELLRADAFVQREPQDGQPASERTVGYLGYDQEALYAVFVCFDREREKLRAHFTRRENLTDEDTVTLYLDTFHDGQRAYAFTSNAAGVQQDAIFTETGGADTTFDTVWSSRGARTAQ